MKHPETYNIALFWAARRSWALTGWAETLSELVLRLKIKVEGPVAGRERRTVNTPEAPAAKRTLLEHT